MSTSPDSVTAFEKSLRKHLATQDSMREPVPGVTDIRQGLDLETLDALRARLGITRETLEQLLGTSFRTLQRRRKDTRRLTAAESDRLWRLLHVMNRALRAFDGDETSARTWLLTPKSLLGGDSPLQRLDTEPGMREVEDMLTVIDETSAA